MESSDSIDKSWDSKSDLTATTALRSDPLASEKRPSPPQHGWMVNVTGRDIVEMAYADVLAKFQKGELALSTLVWREGMDGWAKLESVPAFENLTKAPADEKEEPSGTEETTVAVYERPIATLVFDDAVVDEWKIPPKRESSRSARGSEPSKGARSVSARPVAPSFPTLAPPKSVSVPVDEPPPPPPLPPRRSAAPQHISRRPMPTIPGGLAPPTPPSTSAGGKVSPSPLPSAPPASALRSSAAPANAPPWSTAPKSPAPPATTSSAPSPLLAAIAAAASNPAPALAPTPAPAAASVAESSAPVVDEATFIARLKGTKTISLRNAAIACAGSALLASLVTGLVVGSGSSDAARPAAPSKAVAAVTPPPPAQPVAASPAPTAAPSPPPAPASTSESPAPQTAENVALAKLDVAEKPKPKPTKISAWKPPKPLAPSSDGLTERERLAASPERDDPERAVPDRPVDSSSSQPAADPGF